MTFCCAYVEKTYAVPRSGNANGETRRKRKRISFKNFVTKILRYEIFFTIKEIIKKAVKG